MRFPWLTKPGYAVRKPDGTYRGVYPDMKTANENCLMVGLNERPLFDSAVEIVPCRVRPWVRFGMRARPMGEERASMAAPIDQNNAVCPRCDGDGVIVTGWDDHVYENIEGECGCCGGTGRVAIIPKDDDELTRLALAEAIAGEGWTLVPREPDEATLEAAAVDVCVESMIDVTGDKPGVRHFLRAVCRLRVAASDDVHRTMVRLVLARLSEVGKGEAAS